VQFFCIRHDSLNKPDFFWFKNIQINHVQRMLKSIALYYEKAMDVFHPINELFFFLA